ncbi:hypothetical protein [Devosia nitrariae]|uniref:AAA family ATPase n=1 Tax=Devosia nitrariae TaxID=2071872 RepID=A0ABQ5WBJ5_9HYPH|nr:hypothetical protein [Devosia nitrariae]GLQ57169.1 hypothetical protein GCM10010862_44280 [Devosia nitrariae]
MEMLVNINGWPGVGKLTTAMELSLLVDGRLLDNHTILNVGKAVTVEGSAEFYALVRAVRSLAFDAILALPPKEPVIFTNVVARGGTSGFLEENWQAIIKLAEARCCDLYSVTLTCAPDENARRIVREDRALSRKQRDPELLVELANERVLFDDGATHRMTIDNTSLSPRETAIRIRDWIDGTLPHARKPGQRAASD